MTHYENLKDKPKRVLSLTGYTLEEFLALRPYFSNSFLRLSKQTHLKANRTKNASIPLTAIVACQLLKISCSLF